MPLEAERPYLSGRFCGLSPVTEIVLVSPVLMVPGLAEQATVGGSNGLTVKLAEASADSQGLRPS